jgi:preprotein translocase subunit YajC
MKNLWIMAQAAESGTSDTQRSAGPASEISAEPAGQQTQAITAADSNAPAERTSTRSTSGYMQLVFIAVIFVVMFMMLREPRRRAKQQQKMVSSLKKNDKVRTIGGILGTVVDIKGDEVLLKVDENNNTKIWFAASAIGRTLESELK